jgi:ATP-dependent Clp protease ATP-binding subunit ClpC
LADAQEEARSLRHSYVGTEHLLLALLREPDGVPRRLLEARGVTHAVVREKVVRMMGTGVEADSGELPLTTRGEHAMELAEREAQALGHEAVATEQMLIALVRERGDAAGRILLELDVDTAELREEVVRSSSRPAG